MNDTVKNQRVMTLNICTLLFMLISQAFFWKREMWMIQHLEEDQSVPYNNLPEEMTTAIEMRDTNAAYNKTAYYLSLLLFLLVIVNFIVSAEFLIDGDNAYNYNLGTRTIVGLLTVRRGAPPSAARHSHACCVQNTMLVSTKVVGYFSYSRLSFYNDWCAVANYLRWPVPCSPPRDRGISMFTVVPLSYNRIDDAMKKREVRQPSSSITMGDMGSHPVFLLDA